ncbi:hypothetical protein ALP90_200196 [Pseudomonas amygdali pv. ulmi]|uniref:PcfJ-like protein n=2 Tax=Pseudomonas amygdali TaxID=47877 RepID=A0A3M4S8E1_PSEA0|nr:hypothetical protein ALP90_200196 [Pseudomonas amygdali pv. ulmi]
MRAHTLEKVAHYAQATPSVSSTEKPRFGDARSQQVYEQAKQYVVEHKVLRLYQKLDLRAGYRTIVICNTWRIDRCLSSAGVETFEWNYEKRCWDSAVNIEKWPFIKLLPIDAKIKKDEDSRYLARSILRSALLRALYAAGFESLPITALNGISRSRLAGIFIGFYLDDREKNTKLKIDLAPLTPAARALRKNIWVEVIDRQLLSAVVALRGWGASMYLSDYLTYAVHADAVLRIALEHRNCLPLLVLIASKHWGRPELFSRKTWVKDGRKSTLIDRQGFEKNRRLSSFMKPVSHRWLLAAPLTVIYEYAQSPNTTALENIASSNLPKRVPAIVLSALVRNSRQLGRQVLPEYQRIIRLWVLRCCEVWQTRGFAHLRLHMDQLRHELLNLLDWANAEGVARQQPSKNATWLSIERLSFEWHEQRALGFKSRNRGLEWESLLGDCEISGFKVHALTTSTALVKEGVRLHHCVGSYDVECHEGFFRVFGLSDAEGLRCTLNIEKLDNGNWRVQQLRSYCNGPAPKEAHDVSKQIAKRYTALCTETAEKVNNHERKGEQP